MGIKEDIVTFLDGASGFTDGNITKDDDSTHASYDVVVANPPHSQVRDWMLSKDLFGAVTVGDLRAENRRIHGTVPMVEDGRYLVTTWTIAKSENGTVTSDGIKLLQKLDDEIKRVFNATPTNRYVVSWEANNRLINGKWVYSTIFTVAYKDVLILKKTLPCAMEYSDTVRKNLVLMGLELKGLKV